MRLNEHHTVVCVDDDPAILSSLRRSLRREPFRLLTTEKPREALGWVRTWHVSLVITDQRMPEMEGMELLEEVAKDSPATARVILTAFPESAVNVPGLRRRIDCLISKPCDVGRLRELIREILHDLEIQEKSESDEAQW